MNAASKLKADLLALRERVDRDLDELVQKVEQLEEPANDSDWARVPQLAASVGLSAKTIHRYITAATPGEKGTPHPFAIGKGKRTRVHRKNFDAWRREQR